MEAITKILYFVSTALLVPVMLGLLFLLAWSLLEFGGLIREHLDRRKGRKAWGAFYKRMFSTESGISHSDFKSQFFGLSDFSGFLRTFSLLAKPMQGNSLLTDKLVADLEIEIASKLSRMSFGTRIGPMLGLMGTLIPLGPALIGLASGDIQELARNLVVAFSTTVLGLSIGGLCYGMNLARRNWYAQDMGDIEFIVNYLYENEEDTDEVQEAQ